MLQHAKEKRSDAEAEQQNGMEMKVSKDGWCQEVLRDVFHGKGWPCNATQWLQTTTLGRFSGKGSARLCKAGCQTFYAMCGNRVATHRPQEPDRWMSPPPFTRGPHLPRQPANLARGNGHQAG